MADSIPRAYLKEITDALAAETLKVAFFVNITNYDTLTATTYALLKSNGATEVSTASYTTGGYALVTTSSNLATNGAKLTANATTVSSATFTYRYAVIYNTTSGKIRFVKDHGSDQTVTNGTVTITWDATNGIVKFTF